MIKRMSESEVKNYPNIGQSFDILGIVILGIFLFFIIENFIFDKFMGKEVSVFFHYTLSIGISFWIIYSIRKRKNGNATFNFEIENKRMIPVVIIAAITLFFGIISPIYSLIPVPELFKKAIADAAERNGLFSFLLIITLPVLEELIFRGIMLDGLLKNYSPIKSILISSILFGLVYLDPWQFIDGFFIGVFSGWIYYKTKSLSLAIVINVSVNLTEFLIRRLGDFDFLSINKTLVESYDSVLNLLIAIGGSIMVFAVCIYYLNNECKKKEI